MAEMKKGLDELDKILDPIGDLPAGFERELASFLPKGYISVSQATKFMHCPQAWALQYVEGRVPTTCYRMFEGRNVHRAAEVILKSKMLTGKNPPLSLATDTFSDAFEETKSSIEDWDGGEPGAMKDNGILLTTRFHENVLPEATPVAVEERVLTTLQLPDGKKLPLLGIIDSIQVPLDRPALEYDPEEVKKSKMPRVIHDLKVVTDKWGENDLPNDLQFHAYAHIQGIPDVQVDQIVKGRAKVMRPRYEKATYIVTKRDTTHAVAVLGGVAKSIALGHFQYTDPSNWWCSAKWCSMWWHCRGKK